MSHHDELPSIDPAALDDVTGGLTSTPSTSPASNAQVTTALQGITSSLSSLRNNNSGGSSMQSLLPMMMMGKGGSGGVCPCGCGMASCMRR